jgi:hypothetical protein
MRPLSIREYLRLRAAFPAVAPDWTYCPNRITLGDSDARRAVSSDSIHGES